MIKDFVCNAGGVRNKFVIMQLLNRTMCGRGNARKDPMKVSVSMVRGSSNKLKSLKLCGESLFPLVMKMTMQRTRSVHPADVPAAIIVLTNRRGHGGSRQ